MATYIKTLKEDNGDITYPQTTTDAVLTTSGTTLETELGKCVKAEEIGSTADITPTITTAMIKDSAVTTTKIADSAVTSAKIDWTTLSSYGTATLNSSYFNNGSAQWVKIGKIVILNIIDANLSTSPADNSWTIAAITGLPARGSSSSWNYKFNIPGASGGTPLRLGFQPEATTMYFHFSASSAKTDYNASIVYEAADV